MNIDVLTLFPDLFKILHEFGVIGKAMDRGLITLNTHQIRDYATDKHHSGVWRRGRHAHEAECAL